MDQVTFEIIERIAEEHSSAAAKRRFGYLNEDDLKNEIWAICLDKLKDFDSGRGELENFLRVLVKNRLVNRFKDITKSVRSPCPRCPYYDKGNSPSDCSKFGHDRHLCSKWRNFELSVESRNSLLNPVEHKVDRLSDMNSLDVMMGKEIGDLVKRKIDKCYHRDLDELMSGGKVSKQRMKKLRKEVLRIIAESENSDKLVQIKIGGKNAKS